MLFSVIIPTSDRVELLKRTLSSVWLQRFADFEVIVVDNGSTDGTADYLRGIAERVRIVTQSNLGPGGGRNAGARQAQGDYLAFLDSDDLWFPWTLDCFATLVADHGRPAIMAGKIAPFRNESELADVKEVPLRSMAHPDYLSTYRRANFVGAGMTVVRRDAFRDVGGFTERNINCEDHDLILRMGTASGFVQITAPVTLAWRRHARSLTMDQERAAEGCRYLIGQERRGAYPGGRQRRRERREIIGRHVRPVALACLDSSAPGDAWGLYWATFGWHLLLGRLKFLGGFAAIAATVQIRNLLAHRRA